MLAFFKFAGVALRIKRNCSTDEFLNKRSEEYKGYLKSQDYNADLVNSQFEKAFNKERSEFLKKRVKPIKKVFQLVLDYNQEGERGREKEGRKERQL